MATRPSQIDNRNFLAPVGFKFNLKRSPGVAYFCNSANIPDLNLVLQINQTISETFQYPEID